MRDRHTEIQRTMIETEINTERDRYRETQTERERQTDRKKQRERHLQWSEQTHRES